MPGFMRRFGKDGAGATAIEYALIAALMVIALVAAIGGMGTQIVALFTTVQNAFP
jgi:pilus assembly protein Flp/PilA